MQSILKNVNTAKGAGIERFSAKYFKDVRNVLVRPVTDTFHSLIPLNEFLQFL